MVALMAMHVAHLDPWHLTDHVGGRKNYKNSWSGRNRFIVLRVLWDMETLPRATAAVQRARNQTHEQTVLARLEGELLECKTIAALASKIKKDVPWKAKPGWEKTAIKNLVDTLQQEMLAKWYPPGNHYQA
jgi:hypothetical protein